MNPLSIIGAGPGAPDLLTLRAVNRLQQAQVLVWADSLVSPAIAALTPKKCERIPTSCLSLVEIMPLLVNRVEQGLRVVRLHDGDPCLYSAISEQVCLLADAGIPVEVIPGLSAYQATAAQLGAELTIPGLVQTIVLGRVKGCTEIRESERLDKLAALGASLCLYLSARHVEKVQAILLQHYTPDTPVAIGYRVSWPDEWLRVVPLREIAEVSRQHQLVRTTLYIISPALAGTTSAQHSCVYDPDHNHLFRPRH